MLLNFSVMPFESNSGLVFDAIGAALLYDLG